MKYLRYKSIFTVAYARYVIGSMHVIWHTKLEAGSLVLVAYDKKLFQTNYIIA